MTEIEELKDELIKARAVIKAARIVSVDLVVDAFSTSKYAGSIYGGVQEESWSNLAKALAEYSKGNWSWKW